MAHPYKHAVEHRAGSKRAQHILKSGGCVGADRAPMSHAARKAHGGAVAGGSDAAPFSSAGVQDRRSRGKSDKTMHRAAETGWQDGEERHAEGTKSAHRYARGGKVKQPHQINISIHKHLHPPMMGGAMAGPPMGPPPGLPPGGPPPGAPGMMPPGHFARGGHVLAGAATGVGRMEEAALRKRKG